MTDDAASASIQKPAVVIKLFFFFDEWEVKAKIPRINSCIISVRLM